MILRTLMVASLIILLGFGQAIAAEQSAQTRHSLGPVSLYCDKLRAELLSRWKSGSAGNYKPSVSFEVDGNGQITNVKADPSDSNEAEKAAAVKAIEGLNKLDAPPHSPLRLWASLSDNRQELVVTWRDIDFRPYIAEMQKKIRGEWNPPQTKDSWQMIAVFKVSRDGSISGERVYNSSGKDEADQAGLLAVRSASPLPDLPDGSPQSVAMQMLFEFNPSSASGGGTVASL